MLFRPKTENPIGFPVQFYANSYDVLGHDMTHCYPIIAHVNGVASRIPCHERGDSAMDGGGAGVSFCRQWIYAMPGGVPVDPKKFSALVNSTRDSQEAFALKVGMSGGNVQRIIGMKQNTTSIQFKKFRKMAEALGIPLDELEKRLAPDISNVVDVGPVMPPVPTYELASPASEWSELVGAEEESYETDPRIIDQGRFRIRIRGDCMEPRWLDGETIEFEIWRFGASAMPIGEDVVITNSDGLTTFKLLAGYDAEKEEIILKPRNPAHAYEIRVPLQMIARMAVATSIITPSRGR